MNPNTNTNRTRTIMDLKQRKLNRAEWNAIEVPVSAQEKQVLTMLCDGFRNIHIRSNPHLSLLSFMKMDSTDKLDAFLFHRFFAKEVQDIDKAIHARRVFPSSVSSSASTFSWSVSAPVVKLKSIDQVRVERFDAEAVRRHVPPVFEWVLLTELRLTIMAASVSDRVRVHQGYYALHQLLRCTIPKLNHVVLTFVRNVLAALAPSMDKSFLIEHAPACIERSELVWKYADLRLYEHQRDIFNVIKQPQPKLVFYIAPTGTGKTMTPLALCEPDEAGKQRKVLFVCAARHVGVALAKSAISLNKKVAFAFGCESATDIRLHFFAAKKFTRHRRTGAIHRVDNSVGDNVELMISDLQSFQSAMYYMCAFFPPQDIILYWDEPTITLDYASHEFHDTIHRNWKKNRIPNVVLSSATLPHAVELTETTADFLQRFPGAHIHSIVSHDCRKSIPLLDKQGFVVLPHTLDAGFAQMKQYVEHCREYATLLRYFDVTEVVTMLRWLQQEKAVPRTLDLDRYFETVEDIDLKTIKVYYLDLLARMPEEVWHRWWAQSHPLRKPRLCENVRGRLNLDQGAPGIYITTKDAHTLTDGPSLFLAENVDKVAAFCIQQADIPAKVMDELLARIEHNNRINAQLRDVEHQLDQLKEDVEKKAAKSASDADGAASAVGRGKGGGGGKTLRKLGKVEDDVSEHDSSAMARLHQRISQLRAQIKSAKLSDAFVPNTKLHAERWAEHIDTKRAFCCQMEEAVVRDIMALHGVDDSWKILLMMGIGVFRPHQETSRYTEIMKQLAEDQKLLVIIATSDYIYGTNYAFCHGFLSKDIPFTQEKIIQAMGRVGRNHLHQSYTIRFRDDNQLRLLFSTVNSTDKPEVVHMNCLFRRRRGQFVDGQFVDAVAPDGQDPEVDEDEDEHADEEDEKWRTRTMELYEDGSEEEEADEGPEEEPEEEEEATVLPASSILPPAQTYYTTEFDDDEEEEEDNNQIDEKDVTKDEHRQHHAVESPTA